MISHHIKLLHISASVQYILYTAHQNKQLHICKTQFCIIIITTITLGVTNSQHPDQQNTQYCSLDIYITISH
jgi:hypothetical protein